MERKVVITIPAEVPTEVPPLTPEEIRRVLERFVFGTNTLSQPKRD